MTSSPPPPPPEEPQHGEQEPAYRQQDPGYAQQQPYAQQPPYGQQPYGQQGYQAGYAEPPSAPGATAALVLGLIGVTMCGICAPFAIAQGRKAEAAVDTSGGAYGGRGMATAGKILGIVGTVFLVLALLGVILFIIGAIASSGSSGFNQ